MDEDSNNGAGLTVFILIFLILVWPDKKEDYQSDLYVEQQEQGTISRDCIEPENPFDYGSGHYAGYAWAEENGANWCDGNSNSFIEGCEEYLSQEEDYELCLN